jgi:predicted aconitase with swiveling domain
MVGTIMVSIVFDGWTNVKGMPLINILGAVFLSAHDNSDRYKTGINIAESLFKIIQEIGPYNGIQVIIGNATNGKATRAIIEDRCPNIFWPGCLVHAMNLLMHDIIKMKDHDYRWIGALYKRGKKMIRFITNHTMANAITPSCSY